MKKYFSVCGSRYKSLYTLDKNGYVQKKMIKNGKTGNFEQDKIDFQKDIEEHNIESDFQSKLSNAEDQDKIMRMVSEFVGNAQKDFVYEDYTTGTDYVDLLADYAKLKQAFPNDHGYGDNNFVERIKNFAEKRKQFYKDEKEYFSNLKKLKDKKVVVEGDKK